MGPSEARRERALARLGYAASVLLAIAWVAPAPFAMLWPDTVRDLAASWALAHEGRVPLAGPPVNFGPHLGPAWPWLQAIPLLASPTLAAVAVYVGVVAALRFPLLFALGRALGGARLGWCFLAAAAFPSVALYQWEVFFHPDWVPTVVVLSLLLLVGAVRRQSLPGWLASALLLGLAIQMHATAVFYAPVHAWAAMRLGASPMARGGLVLALLAAIAVWFVPLAFSGLPHAALWTSGSTRVVDGLRAFDPGGVGTVFVTLAWRIPQAAFETYGGALGLPDALFPILYGIVVTAAAGGTVLAMRRPGATRRATLGAGAALVLAVACATAVRTYTSFYLVYFAIPLIAVVIGLGLHGCLASRVAVVRGFGIAAAAASMAFGTLCAAGAVVVGASGEMHSRLPFIANLRHPAPGAVHARTVGALARDRLAAFACASPQPITAHGDLAYTWAGSTGLDVALHCPGRAAPSVLGTGARDLTLLTRREAAVLGRAGALLETSGLQLHPVRRVVHPLQPRPIERDWHYFEQLRDRQPVQVLRIEVAPAAGEILMVHRLKPFDSRYERRIVDAAGAALVPCVTTFNSEGYCASGADGPWRLEVTTDAPQWVDVYLL